MALTKAEQRQLAELERKRDAKPEPADHGVYVLTGQSARDFVASMFGSAEAEDFDDDDQGEGDDDGDQGEGDDDGEGDDQADADAGPPPDPASAAAGHRWFSGGRKSA